MRILYLDCFLGFESQMLLGALIDTGVDLSALKAELGEVFPESELCTRAASRSGIEAVKAEVILNSDKTFDREQAFEYVDNKIYKTPSALYVKKFLQAMFDVGEAKAVSEYEICEIYALALALAAVRADFVISSEIRIGSGFLEKDGGYYMLPTEEVLNILKTGSIPNHTENIEHELTSLKGAAALFSIAGEYGSMPKMDIEKIGYGAGRTELSMPNLIRAVLGNTREIKIEDMLAGESAEFADEIGILV